MERFDGSWEACSSTEDFNLFPELSKVEERQEIWTQFYELYKQICAESFSKDDIDHLQADLKQWITN